MLVKREHLLTQRLAARDYSEWKSSVGLAIGARRQYLGTSIEQVAENAQIGPELLRSIEQGSGHLTLQQLYRLCRVLEVPIAQLLLGADPASSSADAAEFIDTYNQIKDPQLKNRISALVSAMADQSHRNRSRN